MLIYRAISPSGKSYIGQTRHSLSVRRRKHESKARCGSPLPFHTAIRKHGAADFRWQVIARASSQSLLDELERQCIFIYNTISPKGYNAAAGGDGSDILPQTRQKIAARLRGHSVSPATRRKIGAALRGKPNPKNSRPLSAAHRAKLSAAATGRRMSAAARAKISASLVGNQRGRKK